MPPLICTIPRLLQILKICRYHTTSCHQTSRSPHDNDSLLEVATQLSHPQVKLAVQIYHNESNTVIINTTLLREDALSVWLRFTVCPGKPFSAMTLTSSYGSFGLSRSWLQTLNLISYSTRLPAHIAPSSFPAGPVDFDRSAWDSGYHSRCSETAQKRASLHAGHSSCKLLDTSLR